LIDIMPILDQELKQPLYMQLYNFLKQEIQFGRIARGEKLPSKRKLSIHLNISQNIVTAAYEQLITEGYLISKPRKGVFVSFKKDGLYPVTAILETEKLPQNQSGQNRKTIDFNHGKIDLSLFPFSVWRKLSQEILFHDQSDVFFNGNVQGEYELRTEIVKYLYQSRGVKCSPEQLVIGAGTQYLIHLLSLMLGENAYIGMEDPGFHRTRITLEHSNVNIIPIELDSNGINMDKLKISKANNVYVTPSHQFPYGMILPINKRLELLAWANKINGYIIEDDYDGEFRYKGKPIPSLQGLDNNGRVIYLGTFSKSLIPSLRISYMVLPEKLLNIYVNKLTIYKQTVSRLHQQTLYRFMQNGHWNTHLNRLRSNYRKKQQTLLSSIRRYMPKGRVEVIGEQAGVHILLRLKTNFDEESLTKMAMANQVKVYPTSIYFVNRKKTLPEILLGFGGLTENEIEEGISLLSKSWFGVDHS
jgi:GntR family transcriptional regulator / MocR family aminotransferase